MTAEELVGRLDRVRSTGADRWIARCPGHVDRGPSLSVRGLEDGRVLLHCFAGCDVGQVVGALGIELQDLFPPKSIEHAKGERRPFIPTEVFEIARQEIAVAAVIAVDMHKGRTISEVDYNRLFVVVERLNDIARGAYGR